jgi:DinB family
MKPLFGLLLLFCSCTLTAQSSSNESLKQQLIQDWERAKSYTLEYVDVMPADKYNFRPTDSVRTFAEQILHFAQSNAGMAFIGTGYKNDKLLPFLSPNFGKSLTAQNKDSVSYYISISYDIMIQAIKNTSVDKYGEMVSWNMPNGLRTTTRLGWIQKAFEHQTHHRGQCTVYLRLAGVHPPAERLWD